jgi:hypothetical protein
MRDALLEWEMETAFTNQHFDAGLTFCVLVLRNRSGVLVLASLPRQEDAVDPETGCSVTNTS